MPQVVRVPDNKLFVSEPSPHMFGNSANPADWKSRGWTNANWLKSRFHKNFAEYHDRRNPNFGVLYVCNDDLVQPRTGFGTHPHRDMEIVTYIVEGELTHQDSNGNAESLGRGSVQFMSAGTGVYHSEANNGDKPCRFIQAWITPRSRGSPPNYGSYNAKCAPEGWMHLVSDGAKGGKTPVTVCQDVDVHAGLFKAGEETTVELAPDRQAYLVCLEGSASLTGNDGTTSLTAHDGAELYGPASIAIKTGAEGAHFLLFKMARQGSGRSDL
ncbi:putative quercetin 2 [Diplonema papillatum]|nr:putative quercetin 2 [Diplonema papillatum]